MKTLTAPTTARGKRASAAQDTMDMTMPGDTEVVTVVASTFRLLTTNLHRANGHSRCCRTGVTRRKKQGMDKRYRQLHREHGDYRHSCCSCCCFERDQ